MTKMGTCNISLGKRSQMKCLRSLINTLLVNPTTEEEWMIITDFNRTDIYAAEVQDYLFRVSELGYAPCIGRGNWGWDRSATKASFKSIPIPILSPSTRNRKICQDFSLPVVPYTGSFTVYLGLCVQLLLRSRAACNQENTKNPFSSGTAASATASANLRCNHTAIAKLFGLLDLILEQAYIIWIQTGDMQTLAMETTRPVPASIVDFASVKTFLNLLVSSRLIHLALDMYTSNKHLLSITGDDKNECKK